MHEQTDAAFILVVDDNLIVQEMICWALKLAGYRIATCTGTQMQTWIDTACQSGHLPALLLIDLSIPWQEEDAYRRLVLIRQKFSPHMPPAIIVLTTIKKVYDDLIALEQPVLQKPFHIQDLLQAVGKLVPASE